jgi:outer membrane lipoprotein-sorting protein
MKKLIAVLLLSSFTLCSWSQTVDGIVGKYLESIGGAENWKAVKTMKLTGMVPTPQGDFTFEMFRKTPNKFIISLTVMDQKMVPQAFDGETAWTLNPFAGEPIPQKLPEDQAKAVKLESDFEDPFIDYAKKGNEVTYEGTEAVDGVNCHKLKLTRNKGKTGEESVTTYFLDTETNLPIMSRQTPAAGQMAGQEVSTYYSDYQDTGNGLILPFTLDTKVGGQSVQIVKFTAAEFNGEVSDEIFKYTGK